MYRESTYLSPLIHKDHPLAATQSASSIVCSFVCVQLNIYVWVENQQLDCPMRFINQRWTL